MRWNKPRRFLQQGSGSQQLGSSQHVGSGAQQVGAGSQHDGSGWQQAGSQQPPWRWPIILFSSSKACASWAPANRANPAAATIATKIRRFMGRKLHLRGKTKNAWGIWEL